MKIVLHAGLHKSGTSVVQSGWQEAYREPGSAWYPTLKGRRVPGHHYLVWPFLDAFVEQRAPDLVSAGMLRSAKLGSPSDVIREAVAIGVETLVLSSEELDRVQPTDVERLEEVFAGHEVTLLLTVTRPIHRWCSGWQELVKHGLADYPLEAAAHVLEFAALRPGRLEQIARLLPASRRVIRLVRPSPAEESLAADLADTVGLPDPSRVGASPARNTSMGIDIEVVRRINRADLAMGADDGCRELLRQLRGDGFAYADAPGLARHYEPPDELRTAAEAELAFLTADPASSGVEVLDPHGLTSTWLDPEPPDWYARISRQEAVVPMLEATTDIAEQLWRVRQQRSALQTRLERAERRLRSADKDTGREDPHDARPDRAEQRKIGRRLIARLRAMIGRG